MEENKFEANYGNFKAEGIITDIRLAREGKTKNNNDYKVLNLRIKTDKDKILNMELFGQVQSEIEVVKFKGKERETKKIKWSERNNIGDGYTLQNFGSVKVGTEIKTGATNTIQTLTSFDGISEIINNFHIGDSIHVDGNIQWQSFTSNQDGSLRTSMKFSIQRIWKVNEIDFNSENFEELCHFSQPIVVEDTQLDEDKENLIVSAIIITDKEGSFVRTTLNVPLLTRKNLAKTLNNKSKVPRYSVLPVSGNIVNKLIEEVVATEDDEWGVDTQEAPVTRSTGNILEIKAADGTKLEENRYKEDDFIYDALSEEENIVVEDDGNPFETEDDDFGLDNDNDWLDGLE